MKNLKKCLQDDLNNGLSSHSLGSLAGNCKKWLSTSQNIKEDRNLITVYMLQTCSYDLRGCIDGRLPMSDTDHAAIIDAVEKPLRSLINLLDSDDLPKREQALNKLIQAIFSI